jgi:hypothetical protein
MATDKAGLHNVDIKDDIESPSTTTYSPVSEPVIHGTTTDYQRPGLSRRVLDWVVLRYPRWTRTWLKVSPLIGLACLLLAAGSIFASLGVLVASDGSPTVTWSAAPAVYLGIATAVANQSIKYAAIQGVVIAWWARAARGSTVSRLHRDWYAGINVFGAVRLGPQMGLLGLVCILSTVVVIDGPLLQSSSRVVSTNFVERDIPMNVTIAPEGEYGVFQLSE